MIVNQIKNHPGSASGSSGPVRYVRHISHDTEVISVSYLTGPELQPALSVRRRCSTLAISSEKLVK